MKSYRAAGRSTVRCRRRTRSAPDSTTRASDPSTRYLRDSGRAEYVSVTDDKAIAGFQLLARTEGIMAALESSHAIAYLPELGKRSGPDNDVVVCLSGRGDKDMETITRVLSGARRGALR